MNRVITLSWLVVGAASISALAGAGRSAWGSHERLGAARGAHTRAVNLAREALSLRDRLPVCLTEQPATGDKQALAPRLHRALAGSGLSSSVLVNLAPQGVTVVSVPGASNARVQRERDMVTLEPVALPELGALLDRWRGQEPCWWVTALELAPEPSSSPVVEAVTPGGDWPLRAVITFENLTLDQSRGGP